MATLPTANALLEELRTASRGAAERDLKEVQKFANEQVRVSSHKGSALKTEVASTHGTHAHSPRDVYKI